MLAFGRTLIYVVEIEIEIEWTLLSNVYAKSSLVAIIEGFMVPCDLKT